MELRKDYILDRWVIIAPGRKKRPHDEDVDCVKNHTDPKDCVLCPGNESKTPPEIGRLQNEHGWKMRWVSNPFPIVDKKGDPKIKTHNEFFTFSDAYGKHEVIVDTSDHNKQMSGMTAEELAEVFQVYSSRIDELMSEPYVKYVDVFKNEGIEAGASLEHSHSQIISLNIVPPDVQRKVDAINNYDGCPYCKIVEVEKISDRRIFENDSFVVFTPYASRFNYEVWVYPKNHYKNFMDLGEDDFMHLGEALQKVLSKIHSLGSCFNIAIYYAPKGEDFHLHVEVYPRIAKWAGFELETGIIVNQVSPEDAAKFYRGEE